MILVFTLRLVFKFIKTSIFLYFSKYSLMQYILSNYESIINSNKKIDDFKSKESVAENNYDELVSYLKKEENK